MDPKTLNQPGSRRLREVKMSRALFVTSIVFAVIASSVFFASRSKFWSGPCKLSTCSLDSKSTTKDSIFLGSRTSLHFCEESCAQYKVPIKSSCLEILINPIEEDVYGFQGKKGETCKSFTWYNESAASKRLSCYLSTDPTWVSVELS